ncbi:MAG: aminotransferase class I/II-fold pyridoxal phosphate-dependent enzyme [Vicinamibacterales bacterium]
MFTASDLLSPRLTRARRAAAPIHSFVESPLAGRANDPRAANFLFGNPHELPLPGIVEAMGRAVVPRHKDWFAYQVFQRPAQEAIAAGLRDRYGLPFGPDDVLLTTGAFAGLATLLTTLAGPGDEVIYVSPPWFFYEAMIESTSASAVAIKLAPPAFDLDVDAIARAITPRTRAVIINSAHNPTGRVYDAATLGRLAAVLTDAGRSHGRPIALLSDEAYSRIVFDDRRFETATAFYPFSFLVYTYGKVLLTPGQRVGYIALAPAMPGREAMRSALITALMVQGWVFPNAVMQYSLPELERLSIDVGRLQVRRDRLVAELRRMGYEVALPESTFYLLPRSPLADDQAFCDRLAKHDVLCMPGAVFDLPGFFRISITANDEMVERALPGFAAALT